MCAPWGLLPHFPCLHILITATLQRHIQSSHLSGAPHPRLSHPPHCHPLYSSNSLWGPLESTAALGRRSRHYLFSSVSLLLEGRNGPVSRVQKSSWCQVGTRPRSRTRPLERNLAITNYTGNAHSHPPGDSAPQHTPARNSHPCSLQTAHNRKGKRRLTRTSSIRRVRNWLLSMDHSTERCIHTNVDKSKQLNGWIPEQEKEEQWKDW